MPVSNFSISTSAMLTERNRDFFVSVTATFLICVLTYWSLVPKLLKVCVAVHYVAEKFSHQVKSGLRCALFGTFKSLYFNWIYFIIGEEKKMVRMEMCVISGSVILWYSQVLRDKFVQENSNFGAVGGGKSNFWSTCLLLIKILIN